MSAPALPSPSSPLAILRRVASGRLDTASARGCRTMLYGPGRCHHVAPFEPQHLQQQRCPTTLGLNMNFQRTPVTGPPGQARRFAATAEGCAANPNCAVTPPFSAPAGTAAVLAASAVLSAAAKGLKPSTGPSSSGAAGGSTPAVTTPEPAATSPAAPSCSSSGAASRAPSTASSTLPASSSSSSNPSVTKHPTTTASASVSPSPSPPSPPSSTSPASSSSSSSPLEGVRVPWVTLGPSLDLIQQRFRVGPQETIFRLLAPRDVDAVMDLYLEKGLLDADPYWTRAWPSAIALAATLLSRPELVRGKVVADLGAGLGLAGMAAAMAGAKEVVLLDREPLALQCALLSAAATGLDSDPDSHLDPAQEASSTAVPGPGMDPDFAAGPGPTSPSRRRLRLEALPADQLPSHAALQLTPPYKASVRQSCDDGGGCAAAAAAAAEWEALLALARQLHCGSEPVAATAATTDGSPPTVAASSSPSPGSGSSGGGGGGDDQYDGVLRAHVFDWTVPPDMERLLPPVALAQQEQPRLPGRGPQVALRRQRQRRRFDVILACDVLYEDAAVGPIAGLMPLLLEPAGGRLLLADPPNRTVRNRESFLQQLQSGPLRLAVEECSLQHCEVSKLDNEMAGGLAPTVESVPVQFLVFRSCIGNDTVGLKL